MSSDTPASLLPVLVLGLSGKIGSGKSTLSDHLRTRAHAAGWKVYERNLADKLKELVALHFELPVSMCYTQEGKNHVLPERYSRDGKPATLGSMLQLWGTGLRREVHPDLWVHSIHDYVEHRTTPAALTAAASQGVGGILFIIGDVRFPNEAVWVRETMKGINVRLNGDPGGARAASKRDLEHVSETALDAYPNFDLVLDTDQTPVREAANRIIQGWLPWPCTSLVEPRRDHTRVSKQ